MISYRDMTFCPFYAECAKGDRCCRALIEAVKQDADDLGLPVCAFASKPNCYQMLPLVDK